MMFFVIVEIRKPQNFFELMKRGTDSRYEIKRSGREDGLLFLLQFPADEYLSFYNLVKQTKSSSCIRNVALLPLRSVSFIRGGNSDAEKSKRTRME